MCVVSFIGMALGRAARAQDPSVGPGGPTGEPRAEEPQLPAETDLTEEGETVGPTPGAPTISLEQAVAVALENNFGLLSAGDNVAAARYREDAARGEFHPKLTPRYARTADDQTLALDASQRLPWSGASLNAAANFRSFTPEGLPTTRASDLRVTLTQPLLRGFGPNATYFDLTNSRRSVQGQERSYELSRQRLAVDVTGAFYQIVKQRELLRVSRQSLMRSRGLREASEARMKVGLASKLDVFRAELQSSQTEDALVQSQAALETALEGFRLLLGLAPGDPVEPEAVSLPEDLSLDLEPVDVLVQKALDARLDLRETRDRVHDAERAASLARQNLLPQLDVSLAFLQTGFGPTFSDSFRTPDRRLSLFLSTSYPIERSGDKATSAIAALDLEASKRDLRQAELDVDADVRAATRTLERIRKSVELQRKGVEFAAQQHRLATLRYQRGLASNFDVIDAEGSLVSARTALVGLLTDYQVARIQLLRVLGTLDVTQEFAP